MSEGLFSDTPLKSSYALGMITAVNTDRHTVTIQPYSTVEEYKDVPLFRPPGNLSLPRVEDIAIMFINKRGQPIIAGIYPKFLNDALTEKSEYTTQPGDVNLRVINGGQLLILGDGTTRLVDRADNGLELIQASGILLLRSASKKEKHSGVTDRAGLVRRPQTFSLGASTEVSNSDSKEGTVRKIGSLTAPGTLTTTGSTGIPLHEKKTTIKVPGSETAENPDGDTYYEETLGNVVEADALGTLSEPLHTDTALPLRKKIVHYDTDGTTEIIREEIDVNGNMRLFINGAKATTGIKLDSVVPLIAELLQLDITATQNIDHTAGTDINQTATGKITQTGTTIELNGNADNVVLANKLIALFNTHVHSGVASGGSSTAPPTVPWTAPGVGSLTVKAT